MHIDALVEIRRFCKNTQINCYRLDELWEKYTESKKAFLSRENFELGMLALKKSPAKRAHDLCVSFALKNGTENYNNFCKHFMPVSEKFWYLSLLPEDWDERHWVQKEAFIKKLKDKNFLVFIQSLETIEAIQKACVERLNQLVNISQKVYTSPIKKSNDLSEETPEENTVTYFEKLLPLNWAKMNKSERIDFAKKVKHPGFFDYIMQKDSSIKDYLSHMKNKLKKNQLKLYVTLFQFSSETHSEDAKTLLKGFIDVLNSFGRANLQYVECTNPDMIEIREVR